MGIYTTLLAIKKLKLKNKELWRLAEKLNAILLHREERFRRDVQAGLEGITMPSITLEDIEDALSHCLFHYIGNATSKKCPCGCRCKNCEIEYDFFKIETLEAPFDFKYNEIKIPNLNHPELDYVFNGTKLKS